MISDFDKAMFWTLLAFKGLGIKDVAARLDMNPNRLSDLLSRATGAKARADFLRARVFLFMQPWAKHLEPTSTNEQTFLRALYDYQNTQHRLDESSLRSTGKAGAL